MSNSRASPKREGWYGRKVHTTKKQSAKKVLVKVKAPGLPNTWIEISEGKDPEKARAKFLKAYGVHTGSKFHKAME